MLLVEVVHEKWKEFQFTLECDGTLYKAFHYTSLWLTEAPAILYCKPQWLFLYLYAYWDVL